MFLAHFGIFDKGRDQTYELTHADILATDAIDWIPHFVGHCRVHNLQGGVVAAGLIKSDFGSYVRDTQHFESGVFRVLDVLETVELSVFERYF